MKGQLLKTFKTVKTAVATVTAILCLGVTHSVSAVSLAQSPLFLSQPVKPILMLNMSNDHQLYFKVYDDYSDIDGDGNLDTTYNNDYAYYGYFDEDKCYSYSGGFAPSGWASNHYCSGDWSGNFLNWATMTRIDVIRKILYGGMRSTDEATETILERAFLPQDAHSFTKYYNGTDLGKLTPHGSVPKGLADTADTGITMCSTTEVRTGYSQDVNAAPLMQVAKGNYSLWASNERWQCRWGVNSNGNDSALSGMYAHADSPDTDKKLGDYVVKVEVCNPLFINADNNENCRGYTEGFKPAGLLQEYGENDKILFGLMTGSYSRNKSGGVLRKNAGSMSNEVDIDGTFVTPATGGSIVDTLDALRVYGYNFSDGIYNNGDSCKWGKASFNDGQCSNWGNPQSEIYLESLRYLAGLEASDSFNTDDSGRISGLKTAKWVDPVSVDTYCSPLSVIQFNASTSSYDGDQLSGSASINLPSVSTATDYVGTKEGINGGTYFIGSASGGDDQLCTPKSVGSLSGAQGTCPNAPRLEGSYQIAGLAYHARTKGIADDRETVQTFGVALAPAVPKVEVPVPNSSRTVNILPACRNTSPSPDANCAIVDFKIIEEKNTSSLSSGRVYVNWEDSEQGGDFDQDMWGVINYEVSSTEVKVTTQVMAQSAGDKMGFGYVISGTTQDGFHVHSGINGFTYDSPYPGVTACNNTDGTRCTCRNSGSNGKCDSTQSFARTQTFKIGGGSANTLEQPLYYAAKWGGFDTEKGSVTEPPAGEPETYFSATDPRELEEEMEKALLIIAEGGGSAASVATNSTRLGTDTYVYQATFNTGTWAGGLNAIEITPDGTISSTPFWKASDKLGDADSRNIFTSNGSTGYEFEWGNLSAAQKAALDADDGAGSYRVDWIRGKDIGGMRDRKGEYIGDIVNSDPVYGGTKDYGFGRMATHGGDSYSAFVKTKSSKVVYVNANDGMLHAFSAETGNELFAYIPSSIYDKLKLTSDSNYGSTALNPHQYLVDGQIFVGDAYYGGSWKTLLVGALGAGGKGFFVLDVTNPESFDANDVLYETNPIDNPEIGYILGKPTIAPLTDGSWAIVVENGYDSTGGEARLVVAKLGGAKLAVTTIDTGAAGNNGLAEPSMNIFGDGTVEAAYAGDLKGNLWKFDLENKTVAFSDGGTPKPLFVAKDSSGTRQPITAAPVLGINQQRKDDDGAAAIMVYFGTGSYLEINDLSDTSLQSFYGIADLGEQVDRSSLFVKTISQSGGTREVAEGQEGETPELDWENYEGWLVDFNTQSGERVSAKALLVYDRLIFPTIVPTDSACDYGGTSWVMELIAVGDLFGNHGILEEKGTENDTLVSLSDLIVGDDTLGDGVIIQQNSDGTLEAIKAKPPAGAIGRQSWRQLQ